MKCPKCNGTGFVPTNVFGVNGAIKCDFCDGTGVFITNNEETMTNEEWLRSCNMEQLAEAIFRICERATWDYNVKIMVAEKKKELIVEWLKQPHTDKE